MVSGVDEAANLSATESHADHSGHAPASSETAPVHAHQHSGSPATSCPVMMACTAAAPGVITDNVPAPSFSGESPVLVPAAAHASPSLAFEPPPPRQNLI
jgi:hypothetical protein